MCEIMEKYLAGIRAEEHAKHVAEITEIVKNAATQFKVNEEEAISKLKIPEEYREEVIGILLQSK